MKTIKEIKTGLTNKSMLYASNYQDKFIIQIDVSSEGIGVVLAQRKNNEEHPILYLSRKFKKTAKKFAAIIFAIMKLKHYINGEKFVIETDRNPLVLLKNNAGNNAGFTKWAHTLYIENLLLFYPT